MNIADALHERRDEVLRVAARHGAGNVRLFGSAVRGEDAADNDIDLLVDVTGATTPWFPGSFTAELEQLLGKASAGGDSQIVEPPDTRSSPRKRRLRTSRFCPASKSYAVINRIISLRSVSTAANNRLRSVSRYYTNRLSPSASCS
jgi:predicted nucleotidyltransferase